MRYLIEVAKEDDAEELVELVFASPDQNIRRRSLEEIRALIATRTFHIARLEESYQPVGACHIDEANKDPREWEIGGAYVLPEHRRHGVFRVLATTAIVNHLTNNRPVSRKQEPIIGHVVCDNEKPRSVLMKLGFSLREARGRYRPADIPGLEHMPSDEEGYIYADTLELVGEAQARVVEEVLALVTNPEGTMVVRMQGLDPVAVGELLQDLRGQ